MKNQFGQSTLEYLIIVAVIISVSLIIIPKVVNKYKQALNQSVNGMETMADRLTDSHNIEKGKTKGKKNK